VLKEDDSGSVAQTREGVEGEDNQEGSEDEDEAMDEDANDYEDHSKAEEGKPGEGEGTYDHNA
jgi:hypothetical protein